MKTKYYYFSLFLLPLLLFVSTAFTVDNGKEIKNKDIIIFSHALHRDSDIECADCHISVTDSKSIADRLLPTKETCSGCHDVDDDENCETCHYEDTYEPLIIKESRLIFDHNFHLSAENLDCESCHKGFTKVEYSSELDHPNPQMNDCYTCHNEYGEAANVCESCHISTVELIPANHKKVNFVNRHSFSLTSENANCEMCHESSFCESCHIATNRIDVTNSADDFYTPYSPHNYIDNTKKQILTRVHDLNFRYTHGIDAKGKSSDCSTCHENESFCVECHNSEGGDFALDGFLPLSHKSTNFTTFGVGTGGGEHAILAKRDIEQCASCHDTEGADPNCILCHQDYDGIKGNNPRTHERNYLSDVKGDWHDDDGSVCFSCHNRSSQGMGGFCNYCHN